MSWQMLDFDFFTSGSAAAAVGAALAGAAGAAVVVAGVAALVSAGFGSAAYAAVKPKQMVNKETIRIVLVITFSKKFSK